MGIKFSHSNEEVKLEVNEESLRQALMKKAIGYDADEQICEFAVDENGQEVLSKKKVTKKHFAPDLSAIKLVLEKYHEQLEQTYSKMTDEELLAEKNRLLQLLEEENQNAD